MTDKKPPTHCSKPMRRSETKKGNPWWCSECGEYCDDRLPAPEGWTGEAKLNVQTWMKAWVVPDAVDVTDGGMHLDSSPKIGKDGQSIDGSKVIDWDVRYNRVPRYRFDYDNPYATGTFKTADGREFSGTRPDAGSEWILEEVAARPLRKPPVVTSCEIANQLGISIDKVTIENNRAVIDLTGYVGETPGHIE